MIVTFYAITMVLMEEVSLILQQAESGGQVRDWPLFMMVTGMTTFGILWQMLSLGFTSTAFTNGIEPHSPGWLLSVGRYYFWRIFWFGLLLVIGWNFIGWGLVVLVSVGMKINPTDVPAWLAHICGAAGAILLIKPMVLVPADVIVNNSGIWEAVKSLRMFRMSKSAKLLTAIGAWLITTVLMAVLVDMLGKGFLRWVMLALYASITGIMTMVVSLESVRFVGESIEIYAKKAIEESFDGNGEKPAAETDIAGNNDKDGEV